jgi:hypothetical protein
VLDTINVEKKGKPAAIVGLDKLVNTTGKAMARAQGYPALEFAVIPYSAAEWGSAASKQQLKAQAESIVSQIRRILTGAD